MGRHARIHAPAWLRWSSLLALVLLFASVAGLLSPRLGHAFDLQVRSSSELALELEAAGWRPILRGRLSDNVFQGIANAELALELSSLTADGQVSAVLERQTLRSDELGFFELRLDLGDGRFRARVQTADDRRYAGTERSLDFELRRAALRLTLQGPAVAHVPADAEPVELRVDVHVQVDPVAAPLPALVLDLEGHECPLDLRERNELPRWLARREARELAAECSIPSSQLGAGPQLARVNFAGNEYFLPTRAEAELLIVERLTITQHSESVRELGRRGVAYSGELASEFGPLAQAPVSLQVARRASEWKVAQRVLTDAEGRFAGFIDGAELPHGEVLLRAVYVPDLGPSVSTATQAMEVDGAAITSWLLLLIAGLGGLGALVLAVLWTWHRWLELRQRWRHRKLVAATGSVAVEELPGVGPQLVFELSGQVVDAVERTPVGRARVALYGDGGWNPNEALPDELLPALDQDVGAQGGFVLRPSEAGAYVLRVSAPGYLATALRVRVPGRPRRLRFELLSVRERVRQVYAWLLLQYEPDEPLWGKLTPRELASDLGTHLLAALGEFEHRFPQLFDRVREVLAEAVRARPASPYDEPTTRSSERLEGKLVEAVTVLFEEVYYGPRDYDAEVAAQFERLALRLRALLRQRAATRARRRGLGMGVPRPAGELS